MGGESREFPFFFTHSASLPSICAGLDYLLAGQKSKETYNRTPFSMTVAVFRDFLLFVFSRFTVVYTHTDNYSLNI